jgi:hypothetical protein
LQQNPTSNPPNVTNGTNGTNGTNATIPLTNSINISALDVGAPGETAYQEYVEITNTGSSSINMKNWTIKDAGARHTYLFPSYVLKAKSTVTLHSGSGTNTANTLYWNKYSFIWNNNGDIAYLYNSQGKLVSSRGANGTNVTNGTNATVTPKPNNNVTVTPKPIPGTVIPASTIPIKVVDKTNAAAPPKPIPGKLTIPRANNGGNIQTPPVNNGEVKYANTNNEGVQITALHPLSEGVEYVSITNFNDFTAHIEGYKIHEMECNNTITFKNIDILPGHTSKVYTGSHPDGPDVVGTHKLHHIYNQHDTVELICACENVISVFEK